MLHKLFNLSLFLLLTTAVIAQKGKVEEAKFDGEVVKVLITEEGDTIILADFGEIAITDNRYLTRKEQYHHYRVKNRALKVHGYAVEAIRLFNEVQEYTNDMKKRKRKKHIKQLQRDLKKQFDEPLRKLSRYEGYVLICMIERELGMPLYEIVKDLRGWWSANYWQTLSSAYGFDLKEGYQPEKDPVLENVLSDLKISGNLAGKK